MTETLLPIEGFDYTFIYNAIRWAEEDEAFLATLSDDDRLIWGTWDQGSWGYVALQSGDRLPEAFTTQEQYRPITKQEMTETVREGYCKTAYCMAGQAVNQADYRIVVMVSDIMEGDEGSAQKCQKQMWNGEVDHMGRQVMVDDPNEGPEDIDQVAKRLMGLTDEEMVFFSGDNGVDALKEMANWMCQRRGIPLMFPDEAVFEYTDPDGPVY